MRCLTFLLCIVVGSWVAAAETEETKSKEIPLDQIWGYHIPGTRSVVELEPKVDLDDLTKQIRKYPASQRDQRLKEALAKRLEYMKISRVLGKRPAKGESAGEAFIVVGTGHSALKEAAEVLAGAGERQSILPANSDLSLVFYSYSCGRYVRLRSVERWSNRIAVEYQFVSHSTAETTTHFALIPIGKLSDGTYHVQIKQRRPIDETGMTVKSIENPQSIVSNSFSFTVQRE